MARTIAGRTSNFLGSYSINTVALAIGTDTSFLISDGVRFRGRDDLLVAQVCNLSALRSAATEDGPYRRIAFCGAPANASALYMRASAGCKPAIQQLAKLRYDGLVTLCF